ncbi:nicotinate-nucleotide adenylyltransferase [Magnetovibrio sp. PR-2]|uniref:nicotinate-nucleotide adenylyltransferase n=1 Tax=Magnetovibrio sp. PR-2 TaxID=3120356 RepID=UPI002FCDF6E4
MTREIRTVGLLGGSFNPAHEGHVHISQMALDRLGLDQLWWLVSPQNPLKSTDGMGSLSSRLKSAKAVAQAEPRIRVTDAESRLGTRYTVDTLAALQQQNPNLRFVWIIGADNLRQIPKWKGWQRIFRTVPIAVFPRAPYSLRALNGRAAKRFSRAQIPSRQAHGLALKTPPAWVFLKAPLNAQSATRIRRLSGTPEYRP